MTDPLIAPPFLFRFCAPCFKTRKEWSAKGIQLEPKHSIPCFQMQLGSDLAPKPFGDLRMAWNDKGLYFYLQVTGKKQEPWCRESRLDDSDGLTLLIDTRDTHNVHRASRFCHQFIFLPAGEGAKHQKPVVELLNINRAKDNPKQPNRGTLKVYSEIKRNGYKMSGWMPADAITGFDPPEHPRIGFYFALTDRELGWQTLSLGSEYPFQTDPSLWGSLDLA